MGARSILDFACTLEGFLDFAFAEMSAAQSAKVRDQIQVSESLLEVLDETWANWVSERDPRFSDLLPPGRGTLLERIDALTSSPDASFRALEALADAVTLVRNKIEEIEKLPLEIAMREYLHGLSGQTGHRLDALMKRLQWDGSPQREKGKEAGNQLGISRQRIQQLESKALGNRPSHSVVMPALDKAISLLSDNVPIEASDAERLIKSAKISAINFHPGSLLRVSEACRRTSPFKLERVFDKEVLVSLPDRNYSGKVFSVAQRQTTQAGVSNVTRVVDRLAADGTEVTKEDVERILRLYDGIEFFEEGWFWFPHLQNDAVRTISRRMLSVTTPLSIGTLREGIKRVFRFRQSSAPSKHALPLPPPRDVLAQYYRAHPEFVLHSGEKVTSVSPLSYRSELNPTDQVMVEVIRSSPAGVMDRQSFGDACVERGVNQSTFMTMATYSPVIERVGSGLWTIRGTIVDPATVEALRKENALRPREKRIVDHGWTADGLLWIAIRLPSDHDNLVFAVPGAVQRYIAGRDFSAVTEETLPCGTIRIYATGNSAGYSRFLRSQGADEGDVLLARFSLQTGQVILSVIDDDALEELSPTV
jgi:hypothetical protein